MDTDIDGLIKRRVIAFCDIHPDPGQGHTVMLLLSDIEGVYHLDVAEDGSLHVSYDIRHLSLRIIEETLVELGFHLNNSLMHKLKRALYHYTEEVQRANLGCFKDNDVNTREVFINRYQRLRHGCRDERPQHWRKYL